MEVGSSNFGRSEQLSESIFDTTQNFEFGSLLFWGLEAGPIPNFGDRSDIKWNVLPNSTFSMFHRQSKLSSESPLLGPS